MSSRVSSATEKTLLKPKVGEQLSLAHDVPQPEYVLVFLLYLPEATHAARHFIISIISCSYSYPLLMDISVLPHTPLEYVLGLLNQGLSPVPTAMSSDHLANGLRRPLAYLSSVGSWSYSTYHHQIFSFYLLICIIFYLFF